MATANFTQGSVICSKGEPFRHLLIITKGSAETSFEGHVFRFGQGDMLGLNALTEGNHSLTYTAVSDITIFTYPYDGISTLKALFCEKEGIVNIVVSSMCRQISMFLQYQATLKQEAVKAHKLVTKIYPLYEKLCNLYAFTAKKLPSLATVTSPTEANQLASWVHDYYYGINELEPAVQKAFFSKLGISMGFILSGAAEIVRIFDSSRHYQKHIESISKVILNFSGFDLFSVVSELHVESTTIAGADAAVETIMSPLVTMISGMSYVDHGFFKQRLATYRETLEIKRGSGTVSQGTSSAGEKKNLANSMNVILSYADCSTEQANKFTRLVQEYTQLSDRGSSDESAHCMRRELTTTFNDIYKSVFMNSLNDPTRPTIIKMFLNFGYMDAALAGHENADCLYSIADAISGDPECGIYTAHEWLTAVFKGKKEPCRNEFDIDYTAYIAELKKQKRFDDKEEARLLADNEGKLRFEIDNIFPIVNKLVFGRITTFCPVFSDNNVQRGLESSLVTPDAIREAFNEIRSIDFSAFFRETMYSNPEIGITRETIHVEIMPEIILMPNVGVRGIMWQEIEGRKRTTPARMFIPLFLLADLKLLLVRLTGEFRWEMCKRVQGSRWQNITEASLTSEYANYLQFYRSNRDLSAELKVAVKSELTRARNNYKNVFVSNYCDWVMYEASGLPRLNKVARRLLMMSCPFSAKIRETLAQNPQYAEPLKRFNFKIQQREHLLSRVIQKLVHSKIDPPQELLYEMQFVKS